MTQESSIAQDIKILLVVGLTFKLNMDSYVGGIGDWNPFLSGEII